MELNILMDPRPTFPNMYHPAEMGRTRDFQSSAKFYTRTSKPTKYYFIDFGLSLKYNSDGRRLATPFFGGDRSVPEFKGDGVYNQYNPFPTDVYYLGNMIRENFLKVSRAFELVCACGHAVLT